MTTTRALLAMLSAVAIGVAGGCADDDGDTPAATDTTATADAGERQVDDDVVERVAEAAANTVEERTAMFEVAVASPDAQGRASQDAVSVTGQADFENARRLLRFDGPQGELEVIVDGGVAYLELPATEGDDWLRLDLEQMLDEQLGFGGLGALPFQDPADNLRLLEASAVHAQEVGEDEIDGETATHYELILDLEAPADGASSDARAAIEETAERTGLSELAVDVWVGPDDLIRRTATTLDLSQLDVPADAGERPEGDVTVTTDFSDFGADVDIDPPDPQNVVELDEGVLGRLFGQSTTSTTR